jgi:hypothetical protein
VAIAGADARSTIEVTPSPVDLVAESPSLTSHHRTDRGQPSRPPWKRRKTLIYQNSTEVRKPPIRA